MSSRGSWGARWVDLLGCTLLGVSVLGLGLPVLPHWAALLGGGSARGADALATRALPMRQLNWGQSQHAGVSVLVFPVCVSRKSWTQPVAKSSVSLARWLKINIKDQIKNVCRWRAKLMAWPRKNERLGQQHIICRVKSQPIINSDCLELVITLLSAARCPAPRPARAGSGCRRAGAGASSRRAAAPCPGELTARRALTKELWLAPPARDFWWKEVSEKRFCLNYSLPSLTSLSALFLCRNRGRASSGEAFPLPLLSLLLIDGLEIPKKKKKMWRCVL